MITIIIYSARFSSVVSIVLVLYSQWFGGLTSQPPNIASSCIESNHAVQSKLVGVYSLWALVRLELDLTRLSTKLKSANIFVVAG